MDRNVSRGPFMTKHKFDRTYFIGLKIKSNLLMDTWQTMIFFSRETQHMHLCLLTSFICLYM